MKDEASTSMTTKELAPPAATPEGLAREARHEVLVLTDGDVRVGPHFLREVVAPLADKKIGAKSGGYMLMKPLADTAGSLGVRVEYDTRIRRLVVDDSDRVVGLIATHFGKEVAIRLVPS